MYTISAIDCNTIYVNEDLLTYTEGTGLLNLTDFAVYCLDKPFAGPISLFRGAHAEGMNTKSVADAAHAEGDSTVATGAASHTEGMNTTASAQAAHAEGSSTVASGRYAHAEGDRTAASDDCAHAEGDRTAAAGIGAHAEGQSSNTFQYILKINPNIDLTQTSTVLSSWDSTKFSLALGNSSHVEGMDCLTLGNQAHAEGWETLASGEFSHAEGTSATAIGAAAHAEGAGTEASGLSSHAEGSVTTAHGNMSHAEGDFSTAYGYASHAEGGGMEGVYRLENSIDLTDDEAIFSAWYQLGDMQKFSLAKGDYSHVEGKNNLALAESTHAEGLKTVAWQDAAHAEGSNTFAEGKYSHAEGLMTQALKQQAHAEGYSTQAGGSAAHAEGVMTHALGEGSHAEGQNTYAIGNYSHAEGDKTVARNTGAHIEGTSTNCVNDLTIDYTSHPESNIQTAWSTQKFSLAYGNSSHVEGKDCLALDYYTHAEGLQTVAFGSASHAEGVNTHAVGTGAHSEGSNTSAEGLYSHAEGSSTLAYGNYSHAEGTKTKALAYQHAQGHYNDSTKATIGVASGTGTGTAFVIGNGTPTSASNAFRVDFNGKAWCKQAYGSTGADYAEYFEWLDRNPANEDRRGYFVTLDGDKIKFAMPGDYILGIISGMPAIIGNNDEDWLGRYIFDEFGAFITEEFEYEETLFDEEIQEEKTVIKTGTRYKQNPDYDPTKTYTHREDRPEWSAVGMMGVLSVRDDGTCQVNGYCQVAEGGIATAAETGYRVIKRVNDHIVKVIFR